MRLPPMRVWVAFGLGVAFGVACNCGPQPVGASCHTDADCRAFEVCSTGICVAGERLPDGGVVIFGDGGSAFANDSGTNHPPDGGCSGTACDTPCPADGGATLTGVVTDPSGQVPLYDVVVYVPTAQVLPFTPGATCESCGASITGKPSAITLTDSAGHFTLSNVPFAGPQVPVVIQIGHWRRQIQVNVPACSATVSLSAGDTHLPHDRTQGDIPLTAIATGNADPMECLLLKMLDVGEFVEGNQAQVPNAPRVNYFVTNGWAMSTNTPSGPALYGSLGTLMQYDQVLLPCEGSAHRQDAGYVQNMIDYANDGGRFFTTHYGYQWLGNNYGQAPFTNTGSWCPQSGGTCPHTQGNWPQDGIRVAINTGFPKGQAFSDWLGNVGALDGGLLPIIQPRYDLGTVNASPPDWVNPTTAWMFGDPNADWVPGTSNYTWTPHMTFNMPYDPPPLPDGDAGTICGRVVYSDFHVNTDDQVPDAGKVDFPAECVSGQPYTAQEKALLFMLFDLASCVQNNATAPTTCQSIGGACGTSGDCCAGLACLNGNGIVCTNGADAGCACTAVIQ